MANLTNGTLDTRLSQNLVKEFNIPANKEYDKFNPFKIGGGNAIWITHIPPNVKVWFSTDHNFDNAQRLDYMNRGMRYLKIGEQGITRLYDNFFIFTEGTAEDDFIKICVSTQGEDVEPILSSNTNQIDQVDSVGRINTIKRIEQLELIQQIKQLYFKPPIFTFKVQGEASGINTKNGIERYIGFPLGYNNKIKDLKIFDDKKWYKIVIIGHIDIGRQDEGSAWGNSSTHSTSNTHFGLCNDTNNAVLTDVSNIFEFDNFYKTSTRFWKSEIDDLFDIFGLKFMMMRHVPSGMSGLLETKGGNFNNNINILGETLNSYDYFFFSANVTSEENTFKQVEMHASLIVQFYELETFE